MVRRFSYLLTRILPQAIVGTRWLQERLKMMRSLGAAALIIIV
jgi:hypothetical protein